MAAVFKNSGSALPGLVRVCLVVCVLHVLAACSGTSVDTPQREMAVTLHVTDERGAALAGATVATSAGEWVTDAAGHVYLTGLHEPTLAIVSHEAMLAEPVVVGWSDAGRTVEVALLDRLDGRRWVLHAGGDVMFARRYEEPRDGDPLIPAGTRAEGARHVVSAVAPAFRLGDVVTVNFESVAADLPSSDIYPGKRFILRSHPDTLAGLESLGVTVAALANNHVRDYMDGGLAQTLDAFRDHGIPAVGATLDPDDEPPVHIAQVGGTRVAVLGWTSVTGSVVNDAYPRDGDPIPADLPYEERWQYRQRSWGFEGETWSVPVAPRRIGSAWELFRDAESGLSENDVVAAWASLAEVYPELQDWVARRGHGGAAMWRTTHATERIAALKEEVDVVIVHLHSGFQFQEASSVFVRRNARAAIDAGADLVLGHHPHILQGMEWYRGRLIVYSLGNFVFDQDFLVTFPSAFLRVVWDSDRVVEARLLPLELVDYRPSPVADDAALSNLARVLDRGLMDSESRRDPVTDAVCAYPLARDSLSVPAHLVLERHTGRIVAAPPASEPQTVVVPGDSYLAWPKHQLLPARLHATAGDSTGVEVGRDLLGWGRFEDEVANGHFAGSVHWSLSDGDHETIRHGDAPDGASFLRISRTGRNRSVAVVRPVARVPLPRHRLYAEGGAGPSPLDPPAAFSVVGTARLEGGGLPSVRLDLYHFDDTDPTEDPLSVEMGRVELAIPAVADGTWQPFDVPIPPEILDADPPVNVVMLYLALAPPASGDSHVDLDELGVVEWRSTGPMPEGYGAFTYVRNRGPEPVTLSFESLPLR